MTTMTNRKRGETSAAMPNLIQLYPKTDRPYKAQSKDEPWVVFLLWVASINKGYVGICMDRGDDLETLLSQSNSLFYKAKANPDSNHPLDVALGSLRHQSEITGKILRHCSNKQRALQGRRHFIEKLQPQLNKPGYIKPKTIETIEKMHA